MLTDDARGSRNLTSILDHPDFTPDRIKHMKYAGLGGAPVPSAVTTRLEGMGITVFRSYGSTEQPSITGCRLVLRKSLAGGNE